MWSVCDQVYNFYNQLIHVLVKQNLFVWDAELLITIFCPHLLTLIFFLFVATDDDKDVILVLMHHVREPKPTTNIRTWTAYEKVVLHVHVFYHETNNGLILCPQNNDASSLIWNKLLKYKTPDTSGNALGVGDERGHTTNRVRNYSSGNSSSGSKCYQS